MKKILIILSVLLIFVITNSSFAQHYYGNNQQIPLLIDSTKVTIKFDSSASLFNQGNILNAIDRIVIAYIDSNVIDNFVICSLSTPFNYNAFIDSLRAINEINFVEPFYTNIDSTAMLVGTRFYTAFDSVLTASEIDSICNLYNVTILNEIEGLFNVYVLLNTSTTNMSTVDLANFFYEMSVTRYAHPEFGVKPTKFSYNLYDFYGDYQPHTKKVIGQFNVASVWDFAGLTTNIINVAVIDDGVTSHEDLPASRILPGYDYATSANGSHDATPGDTLGHGMGCAGIIGASHTTDSITGLQSSTGMISLNPNANIIPIKIFPSTGFENYSITIEDRADAILESDSRFNADVLSNSWGYASGNYFDVIANAILEVTTNGRNGLGCPVIFASGNSGKFVGLRFPASAPAAFSVGATQLNDSLWAYSSWGVGLDIVAPSGDVNFRGDVWTLDQMSGSGINDNYRWVDCDVFGLNCTWLDWECGTGGNDLDYDCNFGGTSAAAPIVAGVASLILAKDPTLTAQQVYEILRETAVTDLDWGTVTPPDIFYGYGRVDAFRAILSLSRGDVDNSGGLIDISDLVYLVEWSFKGGPAPFPSELLADVDCTGVVDISDINFLVALMFQNGPPIPYPCYEF